MQQRCKGSRCSKAYQPDLELASSPALVLDCAGRTSHLAPVETKHMMRMHPFWGCCCICSTAHDAGLLPASRLVHMQRDIGSSSVQDRQAAFVFAPQLLWQGLERLNQCSRCFVMND